MRYSLIAILALVSSAAVAQQSIGQAIVVSGAASSGALQMVPGQKLVPGQRLNVGDDAALTIRMADDSLLSLGESTDFQINDFAFGPGVQNRAGYTLQYGSVRVVSGAMGKLQLAKTTLTTPYGDVTSERGDYIAGFCAAQCADRPGFYICVRSRHADVSTGAKTTLVPAGQCAYVENPNAAIAFLGTMPSFMATLAVGSLYASAGFDSPSTLRLRVDAMEFIGADGQDFLDGVIDPPASPSQPTALSAR